MINILGFWEEMSLIAALIILYKILKTQNCDKEAIVALVVAIVMSISMTVYYTGNIVEVYNFCPGTAEELTKKVEASQREEKEVPNSVMQVYKIVNNR